MRNPSPPAATSVRTVAVVDLGKTNSKVALVDTATAEEITLLKQAAATRNDDLYPCLDQQRIDAFIIDALATLSSQQAIDAITVTTHGATAALIDAAGELVLPVLDYEFQQLDALRPQYEQCRPAFSETGSPALPGGLNIGAQLFWQQHHYPHQFAAAATLLTWPQYWIYRLCGERCNDLTSLGCHTDLYAPEPQRYSSLISKQGWQSLMPPTTRSGQLTGTLAASLAQRTGLRADTPVYSGIHDSNASLVPHLVNQSESFSVISTGTWFIAMAIGGHSIALDGHRDTLLNVNANGDSVPSARFMGGRERELLGATEAASEASLARLLTDTSSPGMLMPSTVTGTGPYPDATGQWLGAAIDDDQELRNCAIALYLALMTIECMQLIGSDGPTFVEGPLAQDTVYTQMLAAASKRPVLISQSETGTSVGAAMLIRAPDNPPVAATVSLPGKRRQQLEQYATRWQQLLHDHAR